MGKTKCINRSLKDFRDLKTRVSNALGLIDVTITDESLLDVIDLFAIEHNIAQEQVLDRMTDLSKYIEDYFGLNRKYEPVSEESKELYNEWFNDNIEYINTPYTPNAKTKSFENDARIVTEENAKVINLSNGQRMTVIPVFDMSSIYKEMIAIKNKAVADGTFGKVFNKKLKKWVNSNLNPNMWIHVRTKAFKKWFGDWENDPENASKVVDENGEPLAVYHGTTDDSFSIFRNEKSDPGYKGFYFTDSKNMAASYGKYQRPFFLNVRDPYIIDDNNKNWNKLNETTKSLSKDTIDHIRLHKNALQIAIEKDPSNESLRDSYDFFKSEYYDLLDVYHSLGNSIIDTAKKALIIQKLKRANITGSVLETTREIEKVIEYDNNVDSIIFKGITDYGPLFKKMYRENGIQMEPANVYVILNPNDIKAYIANEGTYSLLDNNVYYNVSPITVEKTLTNNGLIHRYNDALFVTRRENKNTQRLKEDIYKELERYGYSKESVSFKNKNNSILVTITEPQRKKDYVETEVNKAMSSIKEILEFLTEKIPALKGKVHYNITVEEATKILRRAGKTYHDGINSFVHNGNIYLIQGKVTQDIAIEEALHILTESLIADNRALASEMLHEAQKLFPQLVEDIRKTYKGKDTQNREILTQALARVFRQEFNEGERQTAENILSKFVNWIKQLFGINVVTGNTIIELDELSTDMTLRDFAQLINSSNAEFKTWSHRKTQFNKSSNITFTTSKMSGYPARTKDNVAWSDVTIGFALDFNTAGEKLTKREAGIKFVGEKLITKTPNGNKVDYPVNYFPETAKRLYDQIIDQGLPTKNIKLNIAGNGIYTLIEEGITQDKINDFVTTVIKELQRLGVTISEIRSGGQTGVDEAGIIAAQRLGIPAVVHGTKDWAFRDKDGKDIKGDEVAYKARFSISEQAESESSENQPTLEDRVAEIEEMISAFDKTIIKDKDFYNPGTKGEHKYYIKTDKGSKEVDISVTSLNDKLLKTEFKGNKKIVFPQGHIGNSFDALVRDYFNLGKAGIVTKQYSNFNNKNKESLIKQLDLFAKELDDTFGKGAYKVITKDWSLGGYVTVDGKETSVAGSIDMMIVTESGDIYIYDMKTTSKDISENLTKYSGQLTFYKELITTNFPEIGKRIKGLGLLVCDINFGRKFGKTNYSAYSLEKDSKGNATNQLLFDGVKIQKESTHINPKIQVTNDIHGGFIKSISALESVENLKKDPINIQNAITEEDIVAKELEKKVKEAAEKPKQRVDVENLGTLKEVVNTDAGLEPVSDVEISFLGKSIITILSEYLDKLAIDDSFRIRLLSNADGTNEYAENYFTSIPRNQILTSDVFHRLLTYIRKNHFNYIKHKGKNNVLYDKMKWINKNFDAIVNSGFAKLITLERVSLTLTKDVTEENHNTSLAEAFEAAQREEAQRMSYDIDAKEKSYVDSIPSRLKTKLHKIYKYKYDEYGNKISLVGDEFGFGLPTFEDGHYVINSIMSLIHGCTTVSSMKKVLNQNIPNYPFLGDVIKMIFNDQELKTQFFRTFRKNATLYNKLYKVKEKDGDYTKTYYRSQPLSVGIKSDVILDNVTKTLETDTPELFSKIKRGIVKVNTVKLEELENLVKELDGLSRYKTADIKKLRRLLSGIGVKNIDNLNVFTNKKFTKSGNTVVNNVSNLLKVLNKHSKQDGGFYYGSELGTSYYYIAKSLNVAMDDTYEISVYDGNKSRMTYTEPTELQTIIETLGNKNPEMSFNDICELKYKKYSQFYNGKTFVSSWLRELQEHPELQSVISHSIRTTFDGIPYLKQNDKQYALSLMLDYASPSISNNEYYKGKENLAFFRVPIMSDKNSSESILFKTYKAKYSRAEDGFGLEEMKQIILGNTYPFFLQELKRMRSVYQHLLKDSNEDIQFYHIPDDGIRSRYVIKDSKGNKKLKELTVKDFLELRKLKNFNGFTFSYVPWFNQAIAEDAKLAQQIVNIINGKASFAGLTKKFTTVTRNGLEADYDRWKNHIENELNITPRELASAITDITTIPNKKNEGELTTYDAFLQEYFWNDYLATCNIYHLTIIDPAFNKNTVDLQKRFAQVHSSTVKCDTEATFKDEFGNERKFSDGTFRFIILKDLVKPSELKEDVRNIFKNAAEKARSQGKFKEARELELLKNTIPNDYDAIDVTDGQAYSSPTGFWKKLSMLGEYDPSFQEYIFQLKDGLNRIANGDFSIRNFNMVKQAFKPFVFGHSEHVDNSTDMGKYLIPTQIKDSEAMIVLYGAIMQGANKNTPLTALFEFMENSHWIEEDGRRVYNDKGIDTIAFASAVKQGAYGVVDINDCKSAKEIKAKLEKATVHTLPFSAWGKQVENPEHFQDHKQGLSSQQRVLSVSDIADDAIITVNDKPYTKEAFLDRYFKLIDEDMRLGVKAVQDMLKLKGSRLDRNKALSTLLQKAVVKDAKYTDALRKAFTLNANGEFDIPLGDPTIADKFFSTVFSLVKKNVNLEEFQGGPVVQLSVFGLDDNLKVAYKDAENKTGLYCEAYMTCPTKELEDRITVTEKNKKDVYEKFKDKYQIGELLETDDAIELGYMTDEEAWTIFDRIPTEDKYSIWPCRIKGFLSRQMGEFCILPKEITKFSGTDFDNDKGFITVRFKNTKSKGNKIKNEIFDMQLASLLHSGTLEKSVHPGSFDPLKDLAKTVDPNFGNNNISLMTIYGQYYYRHNNAAGKEYVGIAALNNICHAMSEMCKLGFSSMFEFKIDGVSSDVMFDSDTDEYRYDTVYSLFDGSRISRNLGMFVGASADNAKDAVLASDGCTPTTATYAKGLLRMGIPLNTVIAMMTNPIMKECVKEAEFSNKRLESVIAEKTKTLVDEEFSGEMSSLYSTLADTDFNTKSLLLATTKENKNINKKVLYFLYAVTPYVSDLAKTNVFFALNSTKNSVGPDVYTTINKELEIEELFNSIRNGDSTIGKSFLNVPQKLPFLQALWECYSELVPEICKEHSPIYHEEFRNIVKELKHKKVYLDDKELKKVYNAYLVFKATKTNALDGTYQGRKSTIFDTPITVFKDKMNIDNLFTYYISVKNKMNRENVIPTLVGNSTNLSTDSKDDLSAHWSVLSKNDKTKQLSNLIFEHFLYKFGFMFHPKSPLSLASPIVKKNYKGSSYNEVFKETSFDKESFDNFLIQYARNNPNSALWIDADPEWEKEKIITRNGDNSISINTEKVSLENHVGINFYGDLFINTTAEDSGSVTLNKVTPLGIKNNFLEYNANENGIDMKTVITDENKEAYQDAYQDILNSLLAYNDFNEEAQEDDYEPPTENEINADDIFDNQMMQSLLQISNYKEFSSRVKARDTSVLNDIYQKLRRDRQNNKEFTALTKMLSEANICG